MKWNICRTSCVLAKCTDGALALLTLALSLSSVAITDDVAYIFRTTCAQHAIYINVGVGNGRERTRPFFRVLITGVNVARLVEVERRTMVSSEAHALLRY